MTHSRRRPPSLLACLLVLLVGSVLHQHTSDEAAAGGAKSITPLLLRGVEGYVCGWSPPQYYTSGTGCLSGGWQWCNLWCNVPGQYSGRARYGGGNCAAGWGPSGTTCTICPNSCPPGVSCQVGKLIAESCVPATCDINSVANGGVGNCNNVPDGGTCQVSCNGGYQHNAGPMTCNSPNFNHKTGCVPADCKGTAITYGTVGTCTNVNHGGTCNNGCNSGYVKIGNTSPRTCWFGSFNHAQQCGPAPCSAPAIGNGGAGTCAGPVPSGQTCSHTCNSGFTLKGNARLCSLGSLGGSQSCSPNPCPSAAPANGNFGNCPASIPSGTTCSHQCSRGPTYYYTLTGSSQLSCYAGTLTGSQVCNPDPCNIPTPRNAGRGTCATPVPSGTTCDFQCNPGFTRFGTSWSCTAAYPTSFTPEYCMSNDGTLSNLVVSTGMGPGFTRTGTTYSNMFVPWATTTATAKATLSFPPGNPLEQFGGAKMTYRYGTPLSAPQAILSGANTVAVPLPVIVGTTPIVFTVVSESNQPNPPYSYSYTINLHRLSNDEHLSALSVNPTGVANLMPAFSPNQNTYRIDMHWVQSSVKVYATYAYPLATGYFMDPNNPGVWTPWPSATYTPAINLNVGVNFFQWKQISEDGLVTRVYSIMFHRISNDPTMSLIYVTPVASGLTPAFSRIGSTFSMTILASTTAVTLTATQNYPLGTTLSGSGGQTISSASAMTNYQLMTSGTSSIPYPMLVGDNYVAIKGIAEDQFLSPPATIQYYLFKIHRLSNDATLSSLIQNPVGSGLSPGFSPSVTVYTLTVAPTVTTFTATPTQAYPLASMTKSYNNAPAVSHTSATVAGPYTLAFGDQLLTFHVTSEDGVNFRDYTVRIHRTSNIATLSSLVPSPVGSGLVPAFAANLFTYTMVSDFASPDITFSSTTTSPYAKQQRYRFGNSTAPWLAWQTMTPTVYSASQTFVGVPVGDTNVTVEVMAEDAVTVLKYTVIVTKLGNVAYLSSLTSSAAVTSPAFDYLTFNYNSTIVAATTTLTFKAVSISPTAVLTYSWVGGPITSISSGSFSVSLPAIHGPNVLQVFSISQDGTHSATYTWSFYQTSDDALLTALGTIPAGGGLIPSFNSTIFEYRVVVPPQSGPVVFTSTLSSSLSIQQLCAGAIPASCQAAYPSGGFTSAQTLVEGGDVSLVVLTSAEQRTSQQRYTVVVHTVSTITTLANLTVPDASSGGVLDPLFSTGSDGPYTVYVPSSVVSTVVVPIPTSPYATTDFSVNGGGWVSGINTTAILSVSGITTILIRVTAESGAQETYTLLVDRASNDARAYSLSTVPVGSGLLPSFNVTILNYSISVDDFVTEMSIQSKTSSAKATQQACIGPAMTVCSAVFGSDGTSTPLPLVQGDNTLVLRITSQEVITYQDITIAVHRRSSSSLLASLVSPIIPAFLPTVFIYSRNVSNSVVSANFTPTTESAYAQLSYSTDAGSTWLPLAYGASSPTQSIQLGWNELRFRVVSEDESSTSFYIVRTQRLITDSTLASVSFSPLGQGFVPSFNPAQLTYVVRFSSGTSSVSFVSMPTSSFSSQYWSFNLGAESYKLNDGASTPLPVSLATGDQTLTVRVVAQDGVSTSVYNIVLHKESADASLSMLSVSPSNLVPGFSPGITTYTVGVSASTSTISLTPTPTSSFASIQYSTNAGGLTNTPNGVAIAGGSLAVTPASVTTIQMMVTAEDGQTRLTYSVSVRVASSDPSASALVTVPSGSGLSPPFAPAVTGYSLTLPAGTSTMELYSSLSSAYATQVACSSSGGLCTAQFASGSFSSPVPVVMGGDTNVTLRVTAESGALLVYTITVHVASNDPSLRGITVSPAPLVPPFDDTIDDYTIGLRANETTITILPLPSNPTSTISYSVDGGPYGPSWNYTAHADGSDVLLTIKIEAEDGTIQIIIIHLHSISSDSRLAALWIQPAVSSLVPTFDPAGTNYVLTLLNSEALGAVSWIAASSRSVVRFSTGSPPVLGITPAQSASDQSSLQSWPVGDIDVYVLSTAEDGLASTLYHVRIHRRSISTSLSVLDCGLPMSPPFDTTIPSGYQVTIPEATPNVTCAVIPTSTLTTISYRLNDGSWLPMPPGGFTSPMTLAYGNNTLEVESRSEDGAIVLYTVQLYRAGADATLAALSTSTASIASLSPFFDRLLTPAVFSIVVPPSIVNLAVLAERNDPHASWTFNQLAVDPYNALAAPTALITGGTMMSSGTPMLPLSLGTTIFQLIVVSEDRSITQITEVRVRQISSDSTLRGIDCPACAVGGVGGTHGPEYGMQPPFNASNTGPYILRVPADTTNVTLLPLPTSPSSEICFTLRGSPPVCTGEPVPTVATIMSNLPIVEGRNELVVTITSEDGSGQTQYHFDIYRPSADATIGSVTLQPAPYSLSPAAFTPGTLVYTALMPSGATTLDGLDVVTSSPLASVSWRTDPTGPWTSATNTTLGQLISNVPLTVGDNAIYLLITAEDGTIHEYTFHIYVLDGSTALLGLTVDPSTVFLSPAYQSNLTEYVVALPFAQSQVRFEILTSNVHISAKIHSVTVSEDATLGFSTAPVPLAVGAWSNQLHVPFPSILVYINISSEDPRVCQLITIRVTRSPWFFSDWPDTLYAGQIVPVTLQSLSPLLTNLSFAFSFTNGAWIEPSNFTLLATSGSVSNLTFFLHAPTTNNATSCVLTTTLTEPAYGPGISSAVFGGPPPRTVDILPGSWVVTGMPDPALPLYANQHISLTLKPDIPIASSIDLQLIAVDANGNLIVPGPVINDRTVGSNNQDIFLDFTLPDYTGPYTLQWVSTGYSAPNPIPVVTTAQALFSVSWTISAGMNASTSRLQFTGLGQSVVVHVKPLAPPQRLGVALQFSAPEGIVLDPPGMVWMLSSTLEQTLRLSISSAAGRGSLSFVVDGTDAAHYATPASIPIDMIGSCSTVPPPCVATNTLGCSDTPSPTYGSSWTCTCRYGFTGADCSLIQAVVIPPETIQPTGSIGAVAPLTNAACDQVVLDGSASAGGRISRMDNSTWQWSLVSFTSSAGFPAGSQFRSSVSATGFTFSFAIGSNSYSIAAPMIAPLTTGWSSIAFPASALPAAGVYSFQLIVVGPFGTSTPVVRVVDASALVLPVQGYIVDPLRLADWMPRVTIQAPASTMVRSSTAAFLSSLLDSLCAVVPDRSSATFTYVWNIVPLAPISPSSNGLTRASTGGSSTSVIPGMPKLGVSSLHLTSESLFVPKDFFPSSWQYTISVVVTISTFNSYSGVGTRRLLASPSTSSASASLVISVNPSDLSVTIAGAANRVRPTTMAILFDATQSYDPDVNDANSASNPFAASGLTAEWGCYSGTPTAQGSYMQLPPCNVAQITSTSSPVLSLPPNTFPTDASYVITLTVRSSDGRASATYARLTVSDASSPLPLLTINDFAYWNSPNATFRASGVALSRRSPPTPASVLSWSPWFTTPKVNGKSFADAGVLLSPEGTAYLVLAPNALLPGFYDLTASVCEPPGSDSFNDTLWAVCVPAVSKLAMAAPPTRGTCQVTPLRGQETSTVFRASCQGWIDPQQQSPITYLVKYLTPGPNPAAGQLRTLTAESHVPMLDFVLPAGSIEVQIWIINTLQTAYVWPQVVQVTASKLEPCALAFSLVDGQASTLAQAVNAGDTDRMLQVAGQVADLQVRGACDCKAAKTQYVQRQVALALGVAAGILFTPFNSTLSGATPQLNPAYVQMIASTLSELTICPLLDADMWNLVAALVGQLIGSMPAPSPQFNGDPEFPSPWKVTFDQWTTLADLQSTLGQLGSGECAHVDVIARLQQALNQQKTKGTLPYEPIPSSNSDSSIHSTTVRSDPNSAQSVSVSVSSGGSGSAPVSVYVPSSSVGSVGTPVSQASFDLASTSSSTATLDTSVTTYSDDWAKCRAGSLPPGSTLATGFVSITFDYNGQAIQLPQHEFDLPISDAVAALLDGTAAMNDCSLPLPPVPVCVWYNETSKTLSSSGCMSTGLVHLTTPSDPDHTYPAIHCICNHTTEFAALLEESQETADRCTYSEFGKTWYMIFMIVYSLLAICAGVQSHRMFRYSRFAAGLLLSLHMLILGVCFFRALTMLIFWRFTQQLSLPVQTFIASIAYLFCSWVFTLVIFTWASVVVQTSHRRQSVKRNVPNPIYVYRRGVYFVNGLITVIFFGIFVAMASASDIDRMQHYSRIGTWMVAAVSLLYSIFVLYYGLRVSVCGPLRKNDRLPRIAIKIAAYAVALFLCFAASAVVLAISSTITGEDKNDLGSILFFSFDSTAHALILLLMYDSVTTALQAQPTKRASARYTRRSGQTMQSTQGRFRWFWMRNGSTLRPSEVDPSVGDDDDSSDSDTSSMSRSQSSSVSSRSHSAVSKISADDGVGAEGGAKRNSRNEADDGEEETGQLSSTANDVGDVLNTATATAAAASDGAASVDHAPADGAEQSAAAAAQAAAKLGHGWMIASDALNDVNPEMAPSLPRGQSLLSGRISAGQTPLRTPSLLRSSSRSRASGGALVASGEILSAGSPLRLGSSSDLSVATSPHRSAISVLGSPSRSGFHAMQSPVNASRVQLHLRSPSMLDLVQGDEDARSPSLSSVHHVDPSTFIPGTPELAPLRSSASPPGSLPTELAPIKFAGSTVLQHLHRLQQQAEEQAAAQRTPHNAAALRHVQQAAAAAAAAAPSPLALRSSPVPESAELESSSEVPHVPAPSGVFTFDLPSPAHSSPHSWQVVSDQEAPAMDGSDASGSALAESPPAALPALDLPAAASAESLIPNPVASVDLLDESASSPPNHERTSSVVFHGLKAIRMGSEPAEPSEEVDEASHLPSEQAASRDAGDEEEEEFEDGSECEWAEDGESDEEYEDEEYEDGDSEYEEESSTAALPALTVPAVVKPPPLPSPDFPTLVVLNPPAGRPSSAAAAMPTKRKARSSLVLSEAPAALQQAFALAAYEAAHSEAEAASSFAPPAAPFPTSPRRAPTAASVIAAADPSPEIVETAPGTFRRQESSRTTRKRQSKGASKLIQAALQRETSQNSAYESSQSYSVSTLRKKPVKKGFGSASRRF